MKSIAWYADRYKNKFGMSLVQIKPESKLPSLEGWQNLDPQPEHWDQHPNDNIGINLGKSNYCSLDIDCLESFKVILEEFGIPIETLDACPTIQGASKGKRVMFRVPDGVDLPYVKLNWPKQDDPKRYFTVFELRASNGDKAKYDALPPSIHPDTKRPYTWTVQPCVDWPTPPDWLVAIWTAWSSFKPQLKDACPWLVKDPRRAPKPRSAPTDTSLPDVQGAYMDANPLHEALVSYGYKPVGKRYLSPHSGTGLPGVILFDDSLSCWIHHASDPLCSEETGQPVSAYDLFCYYEHNNDKSKAFKAAADLLGISLKRKPPEAKPSEATQSVANSAPVSHDPFDLLPLCNDKGKPLCHISNLREICRRLGVVVRYNVITKDEEIIIPDQSFSRDNEGNASIAWLESECSIYNMPTTKLTGFLTYLADMNQYNPVVEWVSSKPWDGEDRLQLLLDTVKLKDESDRSIMLRDTLIKRWMVSAIAGAFSPDGVSAAGVLTFQGDQYLGKTKWFKSLVPKEKNLVKDGFILRPDDRDSVKQCLSYWLVELGELDSTFRRADISALKAFLTQQDDVLRAAYAKKESKYARRTVFFGSVNPKVFLHDPTGNRRYWTIEAEFLDHSHGLDMQQVWAQVHGLFESGFGYYLTIEELNALNEHNEGFTASDPVEEVLSTAFDWSTPEQFWRWMTSTDILKSAGFDRPTKPDVNSCANFIRKLNGNRAKRSPTSRLLFVPPNSIN